MEDLVDGMIRAACIPGVEGEVFNLGCGEELAIRDVVEIVLELLGNPVEARFGALPERPGEIAARVVGQQPGTRPPAVDPTRRAPRRVGAHRGVVPRPAGCPSPAVRAVTEGPWWSRHAREVDEVLAGGDPSSIKRLYVNLGSFLEDDYGEDVEAAPLLLATGDRGGGRPSCLRGVRGTLLDAGCGPNPAVAITLAPEPGRTVVALDIGAGTVRLAVARARQMGVDLLGVVGDVEALPFRTGAFTGGVCDDTIEHLPDDDRGAHELGRVLASGGRMVVATPNRHSLAVVSRSSATVFAGATVPSAYYAAESHLREYTWRGLGRVLAPHVVVRRRPAWAGRADGFTDWRAEWSPCPGCAGSRGCWSSSWSRGPAPADRRMRSCRTQPS